MIAPNPIPLEGYHIRLEPLEPSHADALRQAAADGNLWELWFTAVPEPGQVDSYIRTALDGYRAGHMLP